MQNAHPKPPTSPIQVGEVGEVGGFSPACLERILDSVPRVNGADGFSPTSPTSPIAAWLSAGNHSGTCVLISVCQGIGRC